MPARHKTDWSFRLLLVIKPSDKRYKYVLYDKGRYREQLFDMQNDRGEMRNLIMENSYGQKLQELRDILEKWMNIYNVRPSRPKLHDVPGKTLKNVHK